MIRNYLKVVWRHLIRNKVVSFINVIGLSVGLTCCMLIAAYLYNEVSYDAYHKNIDRLYLLATDYMKEGDGGKIPTTPATMADVMKLAFPEIKETARLMPLFAEDKTLLQYKRANEIPNSVYETSGYMTEASFFKLFTYDFIEGDTATALKDPNTMVLSEETARKIFGNRPALNRIIHIKSTTNGEFDFKVTGVYKPINKPSQIDAKFFISILGGNIDRRIKRQTDLVSFDLFYTFLLVNQDVDPKKLEQKFPSFIDKYVGTDLRAGGFYKKQFLIPVKKLHLYSGMSDAIVSGRTASVTYLYILASVAFLTLFIACINFMNLSTARSSKRSVEVGIRKVLGAQMTSLVRQFFGESLLMGMIAFGIALGITRLLLPLFSRISGKDLFTEFSQEWFIIPSFFILAVITSLIAGSYPAFYLSSFQPARVLKGRFTSSLSATIVRKGLVIFQFIISIVLIIASIVIMRQMKFLHVADLGFAKDQQIVIPLRTTTAKTICRPLKGEIKNNPQVQNAGAALYYPGITNTLLLRLYKEGRTVNDGRDVFMNSVDESLLQTLNIVPIAGRLFSKDFASDVDQGIILNEEAIDELGFKSPQDAVGGRVNVLWASQTYIIIGVVRGFHFRDLHTAIAPYAFLLHSDTIHNNYTDYNYLIVHARAANVSSLLKSIDKSWHKLNPNEPFEYSFLDEDFQKNYDGDDRLFSIVTFFTLVAILISCLGLFGLAAFSAEQRKKEIGIRKVLGASVTGIVLLLIKDLLWLVAIAIPIASPIGWFVMDKWLQNFAYRTRVNWTVFVISSMMAILVAVITTCSQAMKAAGANPVNSLRAEQ